MLRRILCSNVLSNILCGTLFIVLGSSKMLLMKLSVSDGGNYRFIPLTVNISSQFVKIFVCLVAYLVTKLMSRGNTEGVVEEGRTSRGLLDLIKWSVPGLLYFFDELIAFFIMKQLDPSVAVLLGNFGLLTTAGLYRLILKRKLSHIQWVSLLVLLFAIMSLTSESHEHAPVEHHRAHPMSGEVPDLEVV